MNNKIKVGEAVTWEGGNEWGFVSRIDDDGSIWCDRWYYIDGSDVSTDKPGWIDIMGAIRYVSKVVKHKQKENDAVDFLKNAWLRSLIAECKAKGD